MLEASTGPSPELLSTYTQALRGKRDLQAGAKVFSERCSTCHQAHGVGYAVGPDLTSEFGRAEETIVRDILAPNEALAAGYLTCTITTTEGRILTGLLAAESATSVTLHEPEGKEQIVLRKDIEGIRSVPISLMPDDLAKLLKPEDVANVVAWLRQPSQRLVLVDDNLNLVGLLNEGAGSAEFESSDMFAGKLSLRITPPQRFSSRIAGWNFPIREKPGPGEYRFMRYAWKGAGGKGIMLELADNGRWPPAERPLRRYFAGMNATGWQAKQIAEGAPTEWTDQVRDLWADFGDFSLTGIAPTHWQSPPTTINART